jgi:DNA-nicking Smr family endonuclease
MQISYCGQGAKGAWPLEKPMEGRSRRRFPSKEELELWAKVTRRDEPLAGVRPLARQEPGGAPAPASSEQEALAPRRMVSDGAAGGVHPQKMKPAAPPPPQPFDPRAAKRLARGRHEIDARLDLHGLRQQDAYAVLRRFLARCQAEGKRHVLIITGKGGGGNGESEFWTSEERGVLRRLVPHWLCEPALRLHVVSFTESALKHGGSGALYVTLRKAPRSRP